MSFKLAWHSYTLSTPSPQLLPIWKGRNIWRMYRWLARSSSSVGFYCMDSSRVPTHTKGNWSWRYVSWDLGKTSDSQLQLHWNELTIQLPNGSNSPNLLSERVNTWKNNLQMLMKKNWVLGLPRFAGTTTFFQNSGYLNSRKSLEFQFTP